MKADYVYKDSLTATDYVELNKANELLLIHNQTLLKEKQELKKQVENYKKLGFKHLQDKNNNLETQQKAFIKYLEDNIKHYKEFIKSNGKDMTEQDHIRFEKRLTTFQEILQKYKEIIGVSDENN